MLASAPYNPASMKERKTSKAEASVTSMGSGRNSTGICRVVRVVALFFMVPFGPGQKRSANLPARK